MPKLQVDTEKLASGLESGIDKADLLLPGVDELDISQEARLGYALRTSLCGLVSSVIWQCMRQQGIDSRLYISKPRLSFDPGMNHVVAVAGSKEDDDAMVIDGVYSQFLGYVGLTPEYEVVTGTAAFPDEKIMVYQQAEQLTTMAWLTDQAVGFQSVNQHPVNVYGRDLGSGALASASRQVVFEELGRIWQPDHFMPWDPGKRYQAEREMMAAEIPDGTFTAV